MIILIKQSNYFYQFYQIDNQFEDQMNSRTSNRDNENQKTYQDVSAQILQNNNEIKRLTANIIKSNYQNKILESLNQKRRNLIEKQRQNKEFFNSQKQIQKLYDIKINQQKKMKNTLHNQYLTTLQMKHLKSLENEKRKLQQQQNMIKLSQMQSKMQYQRQNQLNQTYKKRAISDLQQKQQLKLHKKQELQREKEIYRQRYENNEFKQNPKKESYQIFFQQFGDIQNKIQENYVSKVLSQNQRKQIQKQNFINKSILESKMKSQEFYEQKSQKELEQKKKLSNFLKMQMEQKQRRKIQEKAKDYHDSINQLRMIKQAGQNQRNKMIQIKQQSNMSPYINLNTEKNQFKVQNQQVRSLHNPITNPIGFKIGITNPYILKQFEKAKEQSTGQRNLILKNLAYLGNSTLQRT